MVLEYNNRIIEFNNKILKFSNLTQENPYQLLNTIATHLRNYITTDLRNPNFFSYTLDGNSYFINDGGNDMFDGGNYTAPMLNSGVGYSGVTSVMPIPPALSYSTTTATVTDTDFYYVSLGYSTSPDRLPLTIIGTRNGTGKPIGFQKVGNIGADGAGNLVSSVIYSGQSINDFTVHAFYRQTYGQSIDPAICDVYILLGHPNWGSVFGSVNSYSYSDKNYQSAHFYTSGPSTKNVLSIATLLSRPTNQAIPVSDIQNVINNYTIRIKEVLGY